MASENMKFEELFHHTNMELILSHNVDSGLNFDFVDSRKNTSKIIESYPFFQIK